MSIGIHCRSLTFRPHAKRMFSGIHDRTVSNITLEQVGEIERRIKEAHERREEARRLQSSTDQMVEAIMNITDEVIEVTCH